MKTKLDSLDELLQEVDTWIDILQDKKTAILKAKNSLYKDQISKFEEQVERNNETISTYMEAKEEDKTGKKNFTVYTDYIYADNYNLIAKKAKQSGLSISSFLKKKYFRNVVLDKDVYKQHDTIKENLGVAIAKGRNQAKRAVGVAFDEDDNETLMKTCAELGIEKPTRMVRFLLNLALYDALSHGDSRKEFGFDKNIDDLKFTACVSSNISGYTYDSDTQTLYIKFIAGRIYSYDNVPEKIFKGLCEAESKGKYFNANIRDNKEYKFKKLN